MKFITYAIFLSIVSFVGIVITQFILFFRRKSVKFSDIDIDNSPKIAEDRLIEDIKKLNNEMLIVTGDGGTFYKRPNVKKALKEGSKSSKMARRAVKKVVEELNKGGIKVTGEPEITIQNMVASANLGKNVDLETAADLLENVMYEPEQFPGLIFRMREPKTVLLIFSSGKIVCTGGKSEQMVNKSVNNLYDILDDFALFYE